MSLILAALSALAWGISDLLGGLQARTVRILSVLTVAMISGLIAIAAVLAISGESFPEDSVVWWALPAGLVSVLALGCLYRALARGPMAAVAPVAAAGAALPVIFGQFTGRPMGVVALLGGALALIGATVAVWESDSDSQAAGEWAKTTLIAVAAALAIGTFFILIDTASEASALWSIAISRSVSVACVLVAGVTCLLMKKPGWGPMAPKAVFMSALIGVSDIAAEVFFALGTTLGDIGPVTVISSLYPALTVVLAVSFLRDPLRRQHIIGGGLTMLGVVLLTIGAE